MLTALVPGCSENVTVVYGLLAANKGKKEKIRSRVDHLTPINAHRRRHTIAMPPKKTLKSVIAKTATKPTAAKDTPKKAGKQIWLLFDFITI